MDSYKFVPHNKAKFVQFVPELISQEPLITENNCKNTNCRYIMEQASHQILSFYL